MNTPVHLPTIADRKFFRLVRITRSKTRLVLFTRLSRDEALQYGWELSLLHPEVRHVIEVDDSCK